MLVQTYFKDEILEQNGFAPKFYHKVCHAVYVRSNFWSLLPICLPTWLPTWLPTCLPSCVAILKQKKHRFFETYLTDKNSFDDSY